MPLHSSLPVPLPISLGGLGTALSAPGVDCFLRVSTGQTAAFLEEVDSNYGSAAPGFTEITVATINSLAAFSQGTYTPTFTNVANVASFGTVSDASWWRQGNRVHVKGRISIDPTSASVNTQFRGSLPIPSALTLFTQLSGTCNCKEAPSISVAVCADTVNDEANFQYINTTETAARDFAYHFSYDVI